MVLYCKQEGVPISYSDIILKFFIETQCIRGKSVTPRDISVNQEF